MPPMNRQWRALDALARDPAFVTRAEAEFPMLAKAMAAQTDRRGMMRLMAAGLALAGLTGCDAGEQGGILMPPVRPAPGTVGAGNELFATAHLAQGYAEGVRLRHAAGRPIKVEGNPLHPASLGGTDAISQAEILGFYDPDRDTGIRRGRVAQAWQDLLTAMAARRTRAAEDRGAGLRLLTGRITSPTLARQIADLRKTYPEMRWHQWEPVTRDSVRAGALLAYGQPVQVRPHLAEADVIVAFDSDLLSSAPGHLRFARDFAARRNPTRTHRMSRVYAVEPAPTLVGLAADHRLIAGPRDLARFVPMLAAAVLRDEAPADAPPWLGAMAADLKAARGRAFVHAGPDLPPESHALVHAMNEALGGRGTSWTLSAPAEAESTALGDSMRTLLADMQAGRVHTLLVLDANPAYTAPGFADALRRVEFSMTMAVGPTETAGATHWSVPQRHAFEDWSDARAFDGTATILQPQARPLFDAISPHTLLSLLAGPAPMGSQDAVRATWAPQWGDAAAARWHDSLANGLVADTASPSIDLRLRGEAARAAPAVPDQPLTLSLRPDPYVWDGRWANNAWLQELPRPTTKLVWDNPLLISPARASALGMQNGDRLEVRRGDARIVLPVWVVPGQAPDTVIATLGYGREDVGAVGHGVGWNVYPFGGEGPVSLRKAEGQDRLASTEHHDPIFSDAGEYVRHAGLDAFKADPKVLAREPALEHLYRMHPPGPAAWGMSVDLNACIGCNACVVACMAENNIPVVGKQQVMHQREMHWLRIDRYYEGSPEDPEILLQPMLCQHCEQAPCEVVCPVEATMHDSEGLNVMVYNRCIGTRFCSNNCPYKVRRFNYYGYTKEEHRPALARNPDVTVRARGVMEKCTFCLQRIAAARIVADIENRPVGAEEVVTACQAACPTQVFSFGNMAQGGAVVERKKSPLSYAMLAEQNTHPRLTYEGVIRNRNQDVGA